MDNQVAKMPVELVAIHQAMRNLVSEIQSARIGIERLKVQSNIRPKRFGNAWIVEHFAHANGNARSRNSRVSFRDRYAEIICDFSQSALDLWHQNMRCFHMVFARPRTGSFHQEAHVVKKPVAVGPTGEVLRNNPVLFEQALCVSHGRSNWNANLA